MLHHMISRQILIPRHSITRKTTMIKRALYSRKLYFSFEFSFFSAGRVEGGILCTLQCPRFG